MSVDHGPEPGTRHRLRSWIEVIRNVGARIFGESPGESPRRLLQFDLVPVEYESRDVYWARITGREINEVRLLLALSERSHDGVTGVGYALMEGEPDRIEWRPLVLLDGEVPGVSVRDFAEGINPERAGLSASVLADFADLPHALFIRAGRAQPLSGPAPGDPIRQAGSYEGPSTVGIRAIRRLDSGVWQPGFLTTGHGFPGGVGTPVALVPHGGLRRWLSFGRPRRIGQVSVHRLPVIPNRRGDDKDYDYAFVDLDSFDPDEWPQRDFEIPIGTAVEAFDMGERANVIGGVSGFVTRASVIGVLFDYESWRDCWLLNPSTAFARGDSGSIVSLVPSGNKLGLLVGLYGDEEEEHQFFVQSLERLLAVCHQEHDIRVAWRSEG